MVPCYEEVVILGDPLAESILGSRLLQKYNVMARRSRYINNAQGDLLFTISMQPSTIFMEYGENDMLRSEGDPNAFVACYRRQIQILQDTLPQTTVHINSILPLKGDAMQHNGEEHGYHSYNRALRDICDMLQPTFIDNSSLMEWGGKVCEYDGMHPKYPYYPKQFRHMAAYAGLLPKESG